MILFEVFLRKSEKLIRAQRGRGRVGNFFGKHRRGEYFSGPKSIVFNI